MRLLFTIVIAAFSLNAYGQIDVPGCTVSVACNYNPDATIEDGSCFFYCPGCIDSLACNYDSEAIQDDGSCIYPIDIYGATNIDCNGDCVNDIDSDGICDEDEVVGCLDSSACNFNELATDSDSCIYTDGICETCSGETNGTGTVLPGDIDDDGICDWEEVVGCQDPSACNFNEYASEPDSCIYSEGICASCSGETNGTGIVLDGDVDGDGVCDWEEVVGCQDPSACNFNELATDSDSCIYTDGICETCSGETNGTGTVLDGDVDNDGVCDGDEVLGCQDPIACNFNEVATDSESCIYSEEICDFCSGETNGTGTVLAGDLDDDGICDWDEVAGCQEAGACNYNSEATDSDDSCEYITCSGCTYEYACNYDSEATLYDYSCEFGTCPGCTNPSACNYNPTVLEDDGSCDFCSCTDEYATLIVEPYQVHSESDGVADLDGMTTYRIYVSNLGPTDFVSSIYGNDQYPFEISAPAGIYNSSLNASWSASGITSAFVGVYPEIEFDSYATIGLSQSAATSGITYAIDPSIVEDSSQQFTPIFLDDGSTGVTLNSVVGMAYYILNNGNPAGNPDDNGRVLIMQITTEGTVSGTINVQLFPNGEGTDFILTSFMFEGPGLYGASGSDFTYCDCNGNQLDALGVCGGPCTADEDADGICDDAEVIGCMDITACNYDATANVDNGTNCIFALEFLDCDGNCINDTDDDGVCDEDEIQGCTDSAACNFDPIASFDDGSCGYIPAEDCDCDGNVLDECGVCGGSGIPGGNCDCDGNVLDECGVCGGSGIPSGNCDCDGNVLDECGTCGGSGIPEGDCDCNGNLLDVLGVCGGDCISDVNNNGICDIDELNSDTVCGEGTSWDSELGQCVVTYPSDSNFDGCVDLNDLLALLVDYGLCLEPE